MAMMMIKEMIRMMYWYDNYFLFGIAQPGDVVESNFKWPLYYVDYFLYGHGALK